MVAVHCLLHNQFVFGILVSVFLVIRSFFFQRIVQLSFVLGAGWGEEAKQTTSDTQAIQN